MPQKPRPLTSPAYIYRLERRLLPKARRAFLAAVARWQQDVAEGRQPDLSALASFVAVTATGTALAGAAAAEVVSARISQTIRFDLTNPHAIAWAEQNAARMITGIGTETQEAVRQAIGRSMRGDLTVQEVAKFVREYNHGIVGLTPRLEDAVWKVFENGMDAGLSRADALAESMGYAEQLRRYRSEVIARSEVLRASNAGQRLLWQQGKTAGMLQGLEVRWISAADDRRCVICEEMDGTTIPIGYPWTFPDGTQDMDPQGIHPQCLPGETRVIAAEFGDLHGATKRWWNGDLIVLRVSARQELRVTPNHPILTPAGWVAAGALNEGDEVVCHKLTQWETIRNDSDIDVPSSIKDVVCALVESGSVVARPVPTSAKDFDGDGVDGEVAIVWTDRNLGTGINATRQEHLGQDPLGVTDGIDVRAVLFERGGVAALVLPSLMSPEHGGVGGSNLTHSSGPSHVAPLQRLSFGLLARLDTARSQPDVDGGPCYAECLRETQNGIAGAIPLDQVINVDGFAERRLDVIAPNSDSTISQVCVQERRMLPGFFGERRCEFPGDVSIHKLLHKDRVRFSGHVYNLQTKQGWYVAESIIVHNCRCSAGLSEIPET